MHRFSRVTQIVLTILFALSLSLQGIQTVAAQDGEGGDHSRQVPAGQAWINAAGQISPMVPVAGIIQDPSFEAYKPNPFWTESSTRFGSPL